MARGLHTTEGRKPRAQTILECLDDRHERGCRVGPGEATDVVYLIVDLMEAMDVVDPTVGLEPTGVAPRCLSKR